MKMRLSGWSDKEFDEYDKQQKNLEREKNLL